MKLQESSEEEDTSPPEAHLTAEVKAKREAVAADLEAARRRFAKALKVTPDSSSRLESTSTGAFPRSTDPAQLEAALKADASSTLHRS